MRKMKFLLPLIFLLPASALAQTAVQPSGCAQSLLDAEALFAEGKLNQIAPLLETCMRAGFTKDEKVQAYKLLSVTYTYLEEFSKAEDALLNLLRLENEYRVNPEVDPTEFIKLFQKFRTYPIFQVGLKIG
ncbi:MAG TPA: hypothetical protein VI583_13700, partial [Cyclobacteriaceae bacterium]|nr:hypothetical protein [Cyclobacteriaceae bacterium]